MPPELSPPADAPPATARLEASAVAPHVIVGQPAWLRRLWRHHEVGAWFISATAHALVLVVLGLIVERVVHQPAAVEVSIGNLPPAESALETLPSENPIPFP